MPIDSRMRGPLRRSNTCWARNRDMRRLCFLIKLSLSLVLVMFAVFITVGAIASGRMDDPMTYVTGPGFLFLAVIPWVFPPARPTRALGLSSIFIGIVSFLY